MGLLPECDLANTLGYDVTVDLIGLWSAKTEHFTGVFYALTFIDTTTNLAELACINTKIKDTIARKFKQTWLACYPTLVQVVHDDDGEFMRYTSACPLHNLRIEDIHTTSNNSKSMSYANVWKPC